MRVWASQWYLSDSGTRSSDWMMPWVGREMAGHMIFQLFRHPSSCGIMGEEFHLKFRTFMLLSTVQILWEHGGEQDLCINKRPWSVRCRWPMNADSSLRVWHPGELQHFCGHTFVLGRQISWLALSCPETLGFRITESRRRAWNREGQGCGAVLKLRTLEE